MKVWSRDRNFSLSLKFESRTFVRIKWTRESLKNLGLDYVDLLMIHWPVALIHISLQDNFPKTNEGYFAEDLGIDVSTESWSGVEKMIDLGLTKSIGVSNFNSR